jgi:hypothetical protein
MTPDQFFALSACTYRCRDKASANARKPGANSGPAQRGQARPLSVRFTIGQVGRLSSNAEPSHEKTPSIGHGGATPDEKNGTASHSPKRWVHLHLT